MPRMQVYLPEDLYAELKQRQLPASELLQRAVRAEIRRLDLIDAAGEHLQELIAETGEPSPEDLAWAEEFAQRVKAHPEPPADERDQLAPDYSPKES